MCTLSWWHQGASYGVFFNRDESRRRTPAEIPCCFEAHGLSYLSPVDPDGGGTWIWVNEDGVISCLLNYYGVKKDPPACPVSRGLLLKSLAGYQDREALLTAVSEADLAKYKGFLLFCMDQRGLGTVIWDCNRLHSVSPGDLKAPITSSGFLPEEIVLYRQNAYASRFAGTDSTSPEELFSYHTFHDPSLPAHSVLMCRPDARTVSLSRIIVDEETVYFSYGAVSEQCQPDPPITSFLKRAH